MATNLQVHSSFNTTSTAPPSYHAISTPVLPPGGSQSNPQMSRTPKKQHNIVLSLIRDLVITANSTPSSVAPTVASCAAALSPAGFSDLLQSLNIEGHTALYWAIVNDRLGTLWALNEYISEMTYACSSDLRQACMVTSNHTLFMQLKLMRPIGPDDEPLKRSLGCPPDDIEVDGGIGLGRHKFVVSFRFKMFQKRLRIIQNVSAEYVAGGRIWWLRIYLGPQGKWRMERGLSEGSLPAHPDTVFIVEAHGGKCDSVTEIAPEKRYEWQFSSTTYELLAPVGYSITGVKYLHSSYGRLGDWVMDDNSMYLDSDGTLDARLEVTLR